MMGINDGYKAVSYTHLDVYKRQALIGILNFINSITTSILSRYREIAMLQSVGMTGWQVKQILIYEGIGYSILGLLGSLIPVSYTHLDVYKRQSMGLLAFPIFPGTAALYLGKNLGIIIGIGKSGFFSSCADGFSLTKILQASLNAVF